ncbi:ESPR-type extended signal peptide-containing protein, partial [Ignatzschineria indica]
MNKIYRVIWSYAKNAYVVVSELASKKRQSKSTNRTVVIKRSMVGIIILLLVANPGYPKIQTAAENTIKVSDSGKENGVTADEAKATNNGSIAIGGGADANGINEETYRATIAIGWYAKALLGGVSMGARADAGDESVALGFWTKAELEKSVALGARAEAKAGSSIVVGHKAIVNNIGGIAIGESSIVSGDNSISIGRLAESSGEKSLSIGANAKAKDIGAIAIGRNAEASSNSSISIGNETKSGRLGVSIGFNSESAENSVALGPNAKATSVNSTAIGISSVATSAGATALGKSASAQGENSVAIGHSSIANEANTVSFGKSDSERRLVNILKGRNDTDAVNVSQLKGVTQALGGGAEVKEDGSIKAPSYEVGGQKADNVGEALTNIDNNLKGVVEGGLKFAGDDADVKGGVKLGEVVNLKGGAEGKLTDKNIGVVADVDDAGVLKSLDVKLAEKIDLGETGSVTTGQTVVNNDGVKVGDKVVLNDQGLTLGNGAPSIMKNGINAGNKKITGVANGADDNDAVNMAQLKERDEKITNINTGKAGLVKLEGDKIVINNELAKDAPTFDFSNGGVARTLAGVTAGKVDTDAVNVSQLKGVTQALGGGAEVKEDGSIKAPSYEVGGQKADNVGEALTNIDNNLKGVVEGGLKFAGDDADVKGGVKLGEVVNLKGGAEGKLTDKNIGVVADVDDTGVLKSLDVKLAEKIDLGETGSVTTGQTVVNNDGVKVGDKVVLNDQGLTLGNGAPSITKNGINAGNKKITGVANGADDNDAVNMAQLKERDEKITNINTGKAGLVKLEGDKIVINNELAKDAPTFDFSNGEGTRTLAGVTAGKVDTDAVNVSQLKGVTDALGGGAEVNADGSIKAPSYEVGGQKADNVGEALTNIDNNLK